MYKGSCTFLHLEESDNLISILKSLEVVKLNKNDSCKIIQSK